MRLDFSQDRLLAIVAHPDDAELLCAGTLARARDDGAAIGVCVLCQGEKGQSSVPVENLAALRQAEMQAAAALLQAELFFGQVPDSCLSDDVSTRLKLTAVLRTFRPTLLLAHSLSDYHTDHRAAGQLAETCSWLSASHGQPVAEPPLEQPPAVWWLDTVGMQQFEPAIFVDVSRYTPLKVDMLNCHRSQLQRGTDGDFTPLLELMTNQLQTRGQQAGVAAAEAFRPHHSFKRTRAW